jgi:hypothetical protein
MVLSAVVHLISLLSSHRGVLSGATTQGLVNVVAHKRKTKGGFYEKENGSGSAGAIQKRTHNHRADESSSLEERQYRHGFSESENSDDVLEKILGCRHQSQISKTGSVIYGLSIYRREIVGCDMALGHLGFTRGVTKNIFDAVFSLQNHCGEKE